MSMTTANPLATRLLGMMPTSYDAENRSVDAILSRGSPVQRIYGTEKLAITKEAINLSRMRSSMIPVLDSHRQDSITSALGRIVKVWFDNDRDGSMLMGTLTFNDTKEGRVAESMVERGEISGISIGYSIENWSISDKKGNVVDPESTRWTDSDLTFTADAWTLVEASLCAVPADASAGTRGADLLRFDAAYSALPQHVKNTAARMSARQALVTSRNTLASAPMATLTSHRSIFDDRRASRLVNYGKR
jgi:phage head maturation protease